jgi:hypothetical protein
MKIEVDIPKGKVCTGCPFSLIMANPDKLHSWKYGCSYLHVKCISGGEYANFGIKHRECPSLTGNIKHE